MVSGWGLRGFVPSSNPPDTNGRVGAKQYVQWNNTSFAVFNKTNGALLYGPAAGNTLFQPLGGACATHNDGDPVVAFDILSGRWILHNSLLGRAPIFRISAWPSHRPRTPLERTTFTIS